MKRVWLSQPLVDIFFTLKPGHLPAVSNREVNKLNEQLSMAGIMFVRISGKLLTPMCVCVNSIFYYTENGGTNWRSDAYDCFSKIWELEVEIFCRACYPE